LTLDGLFESPKRSCAVEVYSSNYLKLSMAVLRKRRHMPFKYV
jgi:hypothetical protein